MTVKNAGMMVKERGNDGGKNVGMTVKKSVLLAHAGARTTSRNMDSRVRGDDG
jgi:hypothetical protein